MEKSAPKLRVSDATKPIQIDRVGPVQVMLRVKRQDGKTQAWRFNADNPGDAISFARSLCEAHGFGFERDAIEWNFLQGE